jgi:hypothetical protein
MKARIALITTAIVLHSYFAISLIMVSIKNRGANKDQRPIAGK